MEERDFNVVDADGARGAIASSAGRSSLAMGSGGVPAKYSLDTSTLYCVPRHLLRTTPLALRVWLNLLSMTSWPSDSSTRTQV